MSKSHLGAASPQTDHQDVAHLGIPQPWHMKILSVLKMPLQRIRQRDSRFPRVVEAQEPIPTVIDHPDVVVR
jgi:hypothetical protein